jgi:hypothetical protein
MVSEGAAISNAAYAVGYESIPQFNARIWPVVRFISGQGCSGEHRESPDRRLTG